MENEAALREICLLLMDELIAYQLVFSEIEVTVEPSVLESRLAHNRHRAALRLSAVGQFSEIEKRVEEHGASPQWRALLQSRRPKVN